MMAIVIMSYDMAVTIDGIYPGVLRIIRQIADTMSFENAYHAMVNHSIPHICVPCKIVSCAAVPL